MKRHGDLWPAAQEWKGGMEDLADPLTSVLSPFNNNSVQTTSSCAGVCERFIRLCSTHHLYDFDPLMTSINHHEHDNYIQYV